MNDKIPMLKSSLSLPKINTPTVLFSATKGKRIVEEFCKYGIFKK